MEAYYIQTSWAFRVGIGSSCIQEACYRVVFRKIVTGCTLGLVQVYLLLCGCHGRGGRTPLKMNMRKGYTLVLVCTCLVVAEASGDNPSFMMVSGISSPAEMCLVVANGASHSLLRCRCA